MDLDATSIEERAATFSLIDYKKLVINSIADLRRLRDISTDLALEPAMVRLIDDVLERIEKGSFSIAVVGEFKRGKSTFINALLGKEILPADIMPCSATLNRVTYGLTPSVQVVFKGENGQDGRVETIGIDQLPEYVTKLTPESEQTAAQVKEAVVTYPLEYLRTGVDLIDTPGLNDDVTMTAVTLSVIPRVDAAILVIMPEAPFAGSEGDFLNNQLLLQDLGRVIFVVTAIDRLRTDKDRERIGQIIEDRIVKSVESRLKSHFGEGSDEYNLYRKQFGKPAVFLLSAYEALEGKNKNDVALLEKSQLPAFEAKLERFLTQTRGTVELKVLANRTVAAAEEILKKVNMEVGALEMSRSQFDGAYESATRELDGLRQRRKEEAEKIDDACRSTRQRLRPLVTQMENDMKRAAEQAVAEAPIQPADLKNQEALLEKLGKKVSEAVGNVGKRTGERIQMEMDRDLRAEIDRLRAFATIVGQTLQEIETQFKPSGQGISVSRDAAGEGLAAAVSGLTGFGGIWSGYREAGMKGALLGGVTSVATLGAVGFGVGVVLAIIGAPLTGPILLAATAFGGIVSIFTGRAVTQKVFGAERVENFKTAYRENLVQQIDQHLLAERIDVKVDGSVSEAYAALKEKILSEVDARVEQTQSTLDELRRKKARDESLSEHRRQELTKLVVEVEGIKKRAHRLSDQLADIDI